MIYPNEVSIIILNYRNYRDTILCLKAIANLKSTPRAVIVVDNDSRNESLIKIFTVWSQFKRVLYIHNIINNDLLSSHECFLLSLDENNGYSSGNNAGIKLALKLKNCKAVWVLNNDTIPDPNSLNALCHRYNDSKTLALIGSTMVFSYDMKTIQCASGYSFFPIFGFDRPLCQGIDLKKISTISQKQIEEKIDFILGASIFIPKDILQNINMFREDFFLYVEEADYCIKAKKRGFPLLWARDSIVFHKEGGTTGASKIGKTFYECPRWVDYLLIRNRTKLVCEHYLYMLPLLVISSVGLICKRIIRKQFNHLFIIFLALLHGVCGKLGKPKQDLMSH